MRKPTSIARRGFSFVELLFAIAVLGIGFIMIAAVFPIGLQQTKLTMDETASAAAARGAVARIEQLSQSTYQYTSTSTVPSENSTSILPDTYAGPVPTLAVGASVTLRGQVRSFRDARDFCDYNGAALDMNKRRNQVWNYLNSLLISTSDSRNGLCLMYKRDVTFTGVLVGGVPTAARTPAASAQIFVINSQSANAAAYTDFPSAGSVGDSSANGALPTNLLFFNLEPRPVAVTISFNATEGVWLATFASIATSGAPAYGFPNSVPYKAAYNAAFNAISEGCYIVISDDRIQVPAANQTDSRGRMNGRTFKLGAKRDDLGGGVWQLAPGSELSVDPGADGAFHNGSAVMPAAGFYKDDQACVGLNGTADTINGVAFDGSDIRVDGPAVAYVLGKSFAYPSTTPGADAGNSYAGLPQDVSFYTTFISAAK